MDVDRESRRLSKRVRKLELSDENVGEVERAFKLHLSPAAHTHFVKGKKNNRHLVIQSNITHDERAVVCGFTNDQLVPFDTNLAASTTSISIADVSPRIHPGLSCLRCSKVNSSIFYTSSADDGLIQQWDLRTKNKPAQTYSADSDEASGVGKKKPLLSFDVSLGDQVLAAGTELVKDKKDKSEDSYVLFWDLRSTRLLGGFWESHSDDVTAIQFHPRHTHAVASGATDGLLNVYDLLQPAEDEALLYSFNTESSVDKIAWRDGNKPSSASSLGHISCITHTNEMRIWDTESGDLVTGFSREAIAEAMMRSNPDAVHLNGCYGGSSGSGQFGILAGSLSGYFNGATALAHRRKDCARFLEVNSENELERRSLFLDQLPVIQTAEYLSKENRWVTFDETGSIKVWKSDQDSVSRVEAQAPASELISQHKRAEKKRSGRFEPYSRDKQSRDE